MAMGNFISLSSGNWILERDYDIATLYVIVSRPPATLRLSETWDPYCFGGELLPILSSFTGLTWPRHEW